MPESDLSSTKNGSVWTIRIVLRILIHTFFDLYGWEDIRNRLLFVHGEALFAANEDLDQFEMYEDISDQISDYCLTFANVCKCTLAFLKKGVYMPLYMFFGVYVIVKHVYLYCLNWLSIDNNRVLTVKYYNRQKVSTIF